MACGFGNALDHAQRTKNQKLLRICIDCKQVMGLKFIENESQQPFFTMVGHGIRDCRVFLVIGKPFEKPYSPCEPCKTAFLHFLRHDGPNMTGIFHGAVADQEHIEQDFNLLQRGAELLLSQDRCQELRLVRMDVVCEQFALTVIHFFNNSDGLSNG